MKTLQAKKTGLILGLLLLMVNFCFGQNNMEDVVYLKNGGIMRGSIIEQIPNQSLKIETVGRNVFVFTFDQIEKITKEAVTNGNTNANTNVKPIKPSNDSLYVKKGRLTVIVEANLGYSIQDSSYLASINSERVSYGGTAVVGLNLAPKVSLGVGGGVDIIGGITYTPIFLDFRYFFSTDRLTPYLSMGVGYALASDYKGDYGSYYNVKYNSFGGIYLNPNIGLRHNASPKTALNFGLGVRIQGNSGTWKSSLYNSEPTPYSFTMTFLNLKIGVIF